MTQTRLLLIDYLCNHNPTLIAELNSLDGKFVLALLSQQFPGAQNPIKTLGSLLFSSFDANGSDKSLAEEVAQILEREFLSRISDDIYRSETLTDKARELLVSNHDKAIKFLSNSIFKLDLTVRLRNVLEKTGLQTIEEVLRMKHADLLKARNCGRKSLRDLVAEVERRVVVAFKGDKFDDFLNSLNDETFNPLRECLDLLIAELEEGEESILEDRYGLWDGKPETLQDIGDKRGVTRERIRQIEKKAVTRLRNSRYREFLTKFLGLYFNLKIKGKVEEKYGLITDAELRDILFEDDREGKNYEELAYTAIADIFFEGKNIFSQILSVCEPGVYHLIRSACRNFSKTVSSIVSLLESKGESQQLDRIADSIGLNKDPTKYKLLQRYLEISSVIGIDVAGKVGLRKWKTFNPTTIPNMAFRALEELGQPSHYSEIWEKISAMFPNRAPSNPRCVHNMLVGMPEVFVRTAMGKYGLVKWNIRKPPFIKDFMIELLENAKRPLPRDYIKEKTLSACNCKEASLQMMLDLTPKAFRKFPDGNYGLSKW
ncbi:MAG: sigma factor-like helix-turn-helix DNA-binding protein [Deltaproteobacteria bacterium]|nr:sigma factor-like helix-turn-helix DNA-binding protein [Deltaproteobacteria bacterium]